MWEVSRVANLESQVRFDKFKFKMVGFSLLKVASRPVFATSQLDESNLG